MKAANVDGNVITAADGRIRKFSRKSFHSLRHCFVSRMANAGIAIDVRASLAGHADAKETGKYSHLGMDLRRKAVNAGHEEDEK